MGTQLQKTVYKKRIMARAASRKSTGRVSRKVSARRACVSRQAKRMHKTATRTRSHQLALARANKACAKKTTRKTRSRKASGSRKGKRMHGMMDRMKASYNKRFGSSPSQ